MIDLIKSVIIKKSSPNDWYKNCIGKSVKVIPMDDESHMPWSYVEKMEIVEIRGIKVKEVYLVIASEEIHKFSDGTGYAKIKPEDCVFVDDHRDNLIDKILG